MSPEQLITPILAVIISIFAIWEYRKRQKRIAPGELIPVPLRSHSEGSMLKAIKVTMGICIGLVLFSLLFSLGWIALLPTINK